MHALPSNQANLVIWFISAICLLIQRITLLQIYRPILLIRKTADTFNPLWKIPLKDLINLVFISIAYLLTLDLAVAKTTKSLKKWVCMLLYLLMGNIKEVGMDLFMN